MRHQRSVTRHVGRCLCVVLALVAMATSVSGQADQKPKRFLTAPLTIDDQGSFFIGGVQKVTNHATVPAPP
ncbi:MAG: hypothetical protein EXQ53_04480, partial [Acidobacteria bacterium]|nr:hypothetical protein [Acidobacteriota bacterium]